MKTWQVITCPLSTITIKHNKQLSSSSISSEQTLKCAFYMNYHLSNSVTRILFVYTMDMYFEWQTMYLQNRALIFAAGHWEWTVHMKGFILISFMWMLTWHSKIFMHTSNGLLSWLFICSQNVDRWTEKMIPILNFRILTERKIRERAIYWSLSQVIPLQS